MSLVNQDNPRQCLKTIKGVFGPFGIFWLVVGCFGSFWVCCGPLWIVVGCFGCFRVLVATQFQCFFQSFL